MNRLIAVLDELLQAYERSTPCIDQELIERVLTEREGALRHYATLKQCFLGIVRAAVVVLMIAPNAAAWDTSKNPDVMPSIGWGLHAGHLPGLIDDNARFTEFAADFRLPVTNYLSLTIDFAQTTVANAPTGVSTDANRVGATFRVYLQDLK